MTETELKEAAELVKQQPGDGPSDAKKPPARKPAAAAARALPLVPVCFIDWQEFEGELRRDAELVEEGIVRAFVRRLPAGENVGMQSVELVAGAVVHGRVVEVIASAGTDWRTGNEADQATNARAEGWLERLRSLCREKGLDLRGGRFGQL